jgi:ribulose-5-phosphate 4-epimerase/fuculose-1-phosphate aldolase
MKLYEERKRILEICNKLIEIGVMHNGHGNVSIYNRESGLVAITPSAVPYEDREIDDICVVDLDGKIVEGKWKSSWETSMHLIYYRNRSDINAVIHTHAPKASVFSVIGDEPMPMILNESAMGIGGPVPVAPYARPGTDELAQVTFEAVGDGFAAIMAHHGLITVGATIDLAYIATIAVESTANTIILARSMGKEPIAFSEEEVKALKNLYVDYEPREL